MNGNKKQEEIDESLYSRQLYVIGKDAMQMMMKSNILVIGLDGLGQEVVKNLCLTGVSKVFIHDSRYVEEEDLCTGFYLSRADIGKKRDQCLLNKFKRLNEYVNVHIADDVSSFEEYHLVIVCNMHVHDLIKYNRLTRRDNSKFIGCQVRGLFSQVFCDFGTDFICVDQNGETNVTGMVNDISKEGVLTVVDGHRHNLENGDVIKILHTKDYDGLLFKITSINQSSVQLTKIDGVSVLENEKYPEKPFSFTEVYGGDYEQVKKPKLFHFKSLEDTIDSPQILSYNFDYSKRNIAVHKCFIVLSDFVKRYNSYPDKSTFLPYFMKNNEDLFEFENLVREFGRECKTTLMPMCSTVGGFVAQEALKAISFKFSPLNQFLYYDAVDAIPENIEEFDTNPENHGRYGPLVSLFGVEGLKKLFASKIMLVGSGAIGCEHLKNIVMCGIATNGEIHVTDMDSIEQSNLNRQFLFSKHDVSKMKAEIAVREAKKLNCDFVYGYKAFLETNNSDVDVPKTGDIVKPVEDVSKVENSTSEVLDGESIVKKSKDAEDEDTTILSEDGSITKKLKETDMLDTDNEINNIKYYNLKVGEETEEVFSDAFYQRMTVVANALDNVEARLYIDNRCLLNRIPLVDAGTSGTKGNVQVVIPYYTENYGASRDSPEKSIPLCTIKNFPHAIEHTIEWAMSEFKYRFHDQILSIKEYIEQPETHREESSSEEDEDEISKKISGKNKETIQDIVSNAPRDVEGCIKSSLMMFVRYFHTSIKDLLTTFPPDSLTKEGQPFWMPPKRAPVTISFDINNDLHVKFVQSAANIYSYTFGIDTFISADKVKDHIANNILGPEKLSSNGNMSENVSNKNVEESIDTLKLRTAEFEKDDDSNFHVDFIYAAANLRAANYKIKNINRLEVKGIAGRIIPAIATTTAMISGLAIIEMIKCILKVPHAKFKNSFLNLALPFFATTDPVEASKESYKVENKIFTYTMWNRIEYRDTKLKNIMRAFEIQFKKPITMISVDNKLIYWDIDSRYQVNLEKKIAELVPKTKGRIFVPVDALTDDDEDNFPRIVIVFD